MIAIIARIKGVFYHLVGVDFIVSPVGETCKPVPIYFVEDVKNA